MVRVLGGVGAMVIVSIVGVVWVVDSRRVIGGSHPLFFLLTFSPL